MKNILLSSAAIVAFAGAAAAEVSWSGDAELGYNDDIEDGVYWSAGLGVDLSQELNNGWTVSASLDVDLDPSADGAIKNIDVAMSDWNFTLENDQFSLSFGDIDTAREAFKPVSELAIANIDDAVDGKNDLDEAGDAAILLAATVGAFEVQASTIVHGSDTSFAQLFVGGEFGSVSAGLFYGEENETIALTLGTSLGGADIDVSFGDDADGATYGVEVSYPVGDVTLGAFYTMDTKDGLAEDSAYGVSADYSAGALEIAAFYEDAYGTDDFGLEVSYDLGTGFVVYAGHVDSEGTYIAGEYDLGGGASFLVSYADAVTEKDDEVGDPEFNDGITALLSLDF